MKHISSSNSAISKSAVAEKTGISRQSLYYQPSLPSKDLILKNQIEVLMLEHKSYGYRRIALALGVNHKKVQRVMKIFGLKIKRSSNYKLKIKGNLSKHNRYSNLLTNLALNAPNQAWVSDFTYLSYQGKFIYLATILDAYTREVIAWNVRVRHNTELITETLISALSKRNNLPQIFHSDQGSEYRSKGVIDLLKAKNIKPSMSQKSSPWQNGKQESFYQKFKLELGHPNIYETQGELIEAIALQIHYYNHKRIHSALKMPPVIFYQRCLAVKAVSS